MLVNLETLEPPYKGWLVPDNPSAPSRLILVTDGGRTRRLLAADIERADLRGAGLHPTGLCGFQLDPAELPEIAGGAPFELYEAFSNTLVLRHAPGADLAARVFHLETQTNPVYGLSRHLTPRIAMVFNHVEMMPQETLASMVRVFWRSVLLSGGTLYRNYEAAFRALEYKRIVLLSRPTRELACRLIRLRDAAADPEARSGWRALGQGALATAFEGVDITSAPALARAFNRIDEELFSGLANPTTRKLTANLVDLPLDKHHVGGALSSLATFDVVGLDDDLEGYVDTVEAILGVEGLPRTPLADPPDLPAVLAALDECRPAAELLELDEAVYAAVRSALQREAAGPPAPPAA